MMLTKITNKRREPTKAEEVRNLDEISEPLARALFSQLPPPVNGGNSLSNVAKESNIKIIVTQAV